MSRYDLTSKKWTVTVPLMKLSLTLILCVIGMSVQAEPTINPASAANATSAANTDYLNKGLIDRLGIQLQQTRESVGDRASGLVQSAMGFLGVPYRFGGQSADTGFDCSGFVRVVFEQSVGKILPRRAEEQAASAQEIDRKDLKPGDLVFFNTMRRAFSHVGIYVGDGKFIHAPRKGANVRVEDMRKAYWQTRFNGARRVQLPSQSTEPMAATQEREQI
jgi:cell wall-associated NlpC family hydrolase